MIDVDFRFLLKTHNQISIRVLLEGLQRFTLNQNPRRQRPKEILFLPALGAGLAAKLATHLPALRQ